MARSSNRPTAMALYNRLLRCRRVAILREDQREGYNTTKRGDLLALVDSKRRGLAIIDYSGVREEASRRMSRAANLAAGLEGRILERARMYDVSRGVEAL